MRVIIAGSRNIHSMAELLTAIGASGFYISRIITGGAAGVDGLAFRYAKEKQIPFNILHANWKAHGNSAGMIRNIEMANIGEALIAVWDGKSRGTEHMIKIARNKGLKVYVHNVSLERVG